jgi:hypothetical protein
VSSCVYVSILITIAILCIMKTYRNLQKLKSSLTAKTYKLYCRLNDTIVLEELIYLVVVGIPGVILIFSYFMKLFYFNIISTVCMFIISLVPIPTIVLNIIYIQPYNRYSFSRNLSLKWHTDRCSATLRPTTLIF